MRGRRLALLAATSAATMALSVPPAFGAGNDGGQGATIEEFACFRSAGDQLRAGTGKVITTPSGNVNAVCTSKRL